MKKHVSPESFFEGKKQRAIAVLSQYSSDDKIADLYDHDQDFSGAMIDLFSPGFEYPDYSHLTIGQALEKAKRSSGAATSKAIEGICTRLLDSEEHAVESAVPDIAAEAVELIQHLWRQLQSARKELSSPMKQPESIDKQNGRTEPDSLSVAYMGMGFGNFCHQYQIEQGTYPSFDGQVEAMSEVIGHALLADCVADYFDRDGNHPGVWLYEVAEPFGEAVAMHLHAGTLGARNGQSIAGDLLRDIMASAGYGEQELAVAFSNFDAGQRKLEYLPIVHGSSLDTRICFAIGELEREQLEETAAEAGVEFDKWTTDDNLRAEVIEAARNNCGIKIFDCEGGLLTLGFDTGASLPVFDPTAEVSIPHRKLEPMRLAMQQAAGTFGNEHPKFTRAEHQREFDCNDTRLSDYWEWVVHQIEGAGMATVADANAPARKLSETEDVEPKKGGDTLLGYADANSALEGIQPKWTRYGVYLAGTPAAIDKTHYVDTIPPKFKSWMDSATAQAVLERGGYTLIGNGKLVAVQHSVTLPTARLIMLTDMARVHLHDIEEGVGDGSYAASDILAWPLKQAVVAEADELCRQSALQLPEPQDVGAATLFWRELSDSVESLTELADQHGPRTLADLMYLQNAILSGGFIDHYPDESNALEILKELPSADRWLQFVKIEDMAQEYDSPTPNM